MFSIPQDEDNRCYRTLFFYGDGTAVYDEARALRLVPFRLMGDKPHLWPLCSDCGEPARRGYVSVDGDDSVRYCWDCVREVVDMAASARAASAYGTCTCGGNPATYCAACSRAAQDFPGE